MIIPKLVNGDVALLMVVDVTLVLELLGSPNN